MDSSALLEGSDLSLGSIALCPIKSTTATLSLGKGKNTKKRLLMKDLTIASPQVWWAVAAYSGGLIDYPYW